MLSSVETAVAAMEQDKTSLQSEVGTALVTELSADEQRLVREANKTVTHPPLDKLSQFSWHPLCTLDKLSQFSWHPLYTLDMVSQFSWHPLCALNMISPFSWRYPLEAPLSRRGTRRIAAM